MAVFTLPEFEKKKVEDKKGNNFELSDEQANSLKSGFDKLTSFKPKKDMVAMVSKPTKRELALGLDKGMIA